MIDLLDMMKQWGRIKAGFSDGPFFQRPARAPNPNSSKDGPLPMTRQAQQADVRPPNAFTGKTFNQRN